MSDRPTEKDKSLPVIGIETEYYLRINVMLVDLGTDTLLKLFKSLVPDGDAILFLIRHFGEQHLRGILSKELCWHMLNGTLVETKLDIGILIKLLLNLLPHQLGHLLKLDLKTLKGIRNELVVHKSTAKITKETFIDKWTTISIILMRILPSSQSIEELGERLEYHKSCRLSSEPMKKILDKPKEQSNLSKKFKELGQQIRGFYTAWLFPVAFVGVVVFLYGVFTMSSNTPANEVCNSNQTYKMCPLCDVNIGCPYWYLSDVCMFTRVAYLFDHPATAFYLLFVSFWAVTFLGYRKRKNANLAHQWDVSDYEEEEERPRPEYTANAPRYEENPITRVKESLPILSGSAVIIVMMTLVMIFINAVIMYRVLVSIPFFQNPTTRPCAQIISSMLAAVVNLILSMALGRVYEKLALRITEWEMHRTQTEFDDQLTFKVVVFQFVNFYSSIIYIAFFKGRFTGYPGHYTTFFGLRREECNDGGCLVELAQQLAVIIIGIQIINYAQEVILPKLKAFWHRLRLRLKTDISSIKATLRYFAFGNNTGGYRMFFRHLLAKCLPFVFVFESQHEDMETEFGRLQNEKEKENEEHRKQDEERAIEYNQFKQEQFREIASLKDSVANLERKNERLNQQMTQLISVVQRLSCREM